LEATAAIARDEPIGFECGTLRTAADFEAEVPTDDPRTIGSYHLDLQGLSYKGPDLVIEDTKQGNETTCVPVLCACLLHANAACVLLTVCLVWCCWCCCCLQSHSGSRFQSRRRATGQQSQCRTLCSTCSARALVCRLSPY
jgi:hypothetical protein